NGAGVMAASPPTLKIVPYLLHFSLLLAGTAMAGRNVAWHCGQVTRLLVITGRSLQFEVGEYPSQERASCKYSRYIPKMPTYSTSIQRAVGFIRISQSITTSSAEAEAQRGGS